MKNIVIGNFPELDYSGKEAINTLCTNLSFSGENVRKIVVTSSHAGEGKSFTSMNIMRTMAKLGKSVALIDADLRRSMINSRYNIEFEDESDKKGLAHLLAGMAKVEEIIYKTNIKNAYFIPVGREVTNALSLLNVPYMDRLLEALAQTVDYVFVDAPPIGVVIDAAQIAKSCDGALLVVGYNSTRRRDLLYAKEQMEQSGCQILGTVLNQVPFNDYMSRKYYYKSNYSNYYSNGEESGESDK